MEKLLNDSVTGSGEIIKDYATRKGFGFGTIKEPLQILVDVVK